MEVQIYFVDAFTNIIGQGNRAGVVLDANGMTDAQMQATAAFANVSETVFFLEPSAPDHDIHARYFTPTKEVPICGHATIAGHSLRASCGTGTSNGTVIAKTGAGILPVDIISEGNKTKVVMTQGQPEIGKTLTDDEKFSLLSALHLKEKNIHKLPIQIISTGHSKVMIPITSEDILHGTNPDMNALIKLSERIDCNGYFIFSWQKNGDQFKTHGRMFAPAIGIPEDPVTGNANGPAGVYLAHHNVISFKDSFSYQGIQGETIGKRGTVEVSLFKADGAVNKIQVAGTAIQADQKIFTL